MPAKVLDGRYKLIKQIGAGGFGHTFIARDMRRPGSPPCVVKQLKPASDDPNFIREARRLFNTEAETLEKLGNHDQIPQLLAYFEEDKQFFLVQEFVEGQSLYDELKASLPDVSDLENASQERLLAELANIDAPARDKQLSEVEVLKILKDVLEVLEFVHSEGVIHRDIKPDNLIRRKKDQKIILIDFGAVKAMQDANTKLAADEKGESRFTVTIGTPGYMPSEQCAGRPTYNSDIYALGMVAIKAITGYGPTDLPTDLATGELVWRDKAQVSNGLAMVLTRMVRYHYTQRYQSVRDVNQGIATFATMTEVERQATTSKIVRSTILTGTTNLANSQAETSYKSSSQTRRSVPASASASSNSGVLFLFGGLLAVVAVIAAFVLPSMMRNNQSSVIVNNQPIPIKPITTEASSNPTTVNSNAPVNQVVALEANKEFLVIPNKILGDATHTYTVQAKSGQLLSTAITGSGLLFTILNSQGVPLSNAVNVMNVDVPIPADGAYVVQLRGIGGTTEIPYQLKLGLKDVAIAQPTAIPTSTPLTSPLVPPTPTTGNPPMLTPTPVATPTQAPPPPQIEIKVRKNP